MRIGAPNVAVVTLDRPPVNALGRDIREAMLRVFDRLEENAEVNAIVLTARGRVFCAGADIKEKAALGAGEGDYMRANRLTRDAFFCILDSCKPVIAAVQGAALGAGCVLAACCDMIFAAERRCSRCPRSTSARAAARASCSAFCRPRRFGA